MSCVVGRADLDFDFSTTCHVCEAGQYASVDGATSCSACPESLPLSLPGSTSIVDCGFCSGASYCTAGRFCLVAGRAEGNCTACEGNLCGCTDSAALNFNLEAIHEDGTCVYECNAPTCTGYPPAITSECSEVAHLCAAVNFTVLAETGDRLYFWHEAYHVQHGNFQCRPNSGNFDGGAIYSENSSAVITQSTFEGNAAKRQGGGICQVGGDISVTFCSFSGNSVFIGDSNGVGGGALYQAGGTLAIKHTTFFDNHAYTNTGSPGTKGGAIHFKHDTAVSSFSSLNVSHTRFVGNSADTAGALYQEGGAVTMSQTTFGE